MRSPVAPPRAVYPGQGRTLLYPVIFEPREHVQTRESSQAGRRAGGGKTSEADSSCASITYTHTAALPIVQVELHAPAAEEECTTLVLPPIAEVTRETHAQSHWP